MKRVVALCIVLLFAANVMAENLDLPFQPTRRQWLELETFMSLKINTDAWRARIAIRLSVYDAEEGPLMDVVLSTPNGEPSLSKPVQDDYVRLVTGFVQAVLDQYDWAQDIAVLVRFI